MSLLWFVRACVVVTLLALAACGGGSDAIVSTWKMETGAGGQPADGSDRLSIREDLSVSGSGAVPCAGQATPMEEGSYRLDITCAGLVLSLDATVGSDGTMTVRSPADGRSAVYTRVDEG